MIANQLKAQAQDHPLFIGLMSGTSLDGIDGVLCAIHENGYAEVLVHTSLPFSTELKHTLLQLQTPAPNELHQAALAANQLARAYALIVSRILQLSSLPADRIVAIGAHGQTIRHQPVLPNNLGYSLQCLNGAVLAELTGIHVINDFRSRDIAAQGQGAPLVPAFHLSQFGNSHSPKAILNLGGIANLTILNPQHPVRGFDTGPGNLLLDGWIGKHQQLPFDAQGQWAASGKVQQELLARLLDDPYFSKAIPKSTGRELFNLSWLEQKITLCEKTFLTADVQASLVALTSRSIVDGLIQYFPECEEVVVCGGGSKNHFMMTQITQACHAFKSTLQVVTTESIGMDPQTIEAAAFAWLAWCFHNQRASNIPEVTGAIGPRILGTFHNK